MSRLEIAPRNRKTRPPAWLPMKAACSGVEARARRIVVAPPPAPGGGTSTHLLLVAISEPPSAEIAPGLSCSGWYVSSARVTPSLSVNQAIASS
jgi:hypothetical protein